VDVPRLVTSLEALTRRVSIAKSEPSAGDVERRLTTLADALERLIRRVRQGDPDTVKASLTALQQQLYQDFVRSVQRLQANAGPQRVDLIQVPEELRSRYYSGHGLFLLEIHPLVNIWDREGAEQFVRELRGVDPAVTGTPIITYEAIRLMELSYRRGTLYAVALVTLLAALALRRTRETLLTLLPLGMGLVWTAGLMYFFDLKFTLGNVFGLPLIVGAASEYGLNMVLRFVEGWNYGGPLIARSTVMAVLINGLTNVVGFGSLMMAAHRGIFGLGLLLTLGTAMSLLASLVVLPVLLRREQRLREARGPRWIPGMPTPTTVPEGDSSREG
jgi:predicted RND superfamily exporter protein